MAGAGTGPRDLGSRASFLARCGCAGAALFGAGASRAAAAPPSRLRRDFLALARRGAELRGRVFGPGETIPWPIPVHIGEDWTLTFSDEPAIALLRSFGPPVQDIQLSLVSNNVLLDQPDSPSTDTAAEDRQIVYDAWTTPAPSPNRWRVRPALTTDRALRGSNFDKLRFDIGGPLEGFTAAGAQVRSPQYRLAVSYRLNWYRGSTRERALIEPRDTVCVSEQPLSHADYRLLAGQVILFRQATVGAQPLVMVSKPYAPHGSHESYEANYDPRTGIALMNSFYLTHSEPGPLVVLDELLAAAVYSAAEGSPIPALAGGAERVALAYTTIKTRSAALDLFRVLGARAAASASEAFAIGLTAIRLGPSAFERGFAGLESADRQAAREFRDAIVALLESGLKLQGRTDLLDHFVSPRLRRL